MSPVGGGLATDTRTVDVGRRMLSRTPPGKRTPLPTFRDAQALTEGVGAVVFPGHYPIPSWASVPSGRLDVEAMTALLVGVRRRVESMADAEQKAMGASIDVLDTGRAVEAALPSIQQWLWEDAEVALAQDPAARSLLEVIACYPGLQAILCYRLAHVLVQNGLTVVPRLVAEYAHSKTGIDIHPAATIGRRFFIDHGTGIVVGATCEIGDDVILYQGVTLGARSFVLDEGRRPVKGVPRHPVVEDGVTIYSGATVLGRVVVGKGSVIGGNVWVVSDVPAGSVVTQAQSRFDRFTEGDGI